MLEIPPAAVSTIMVVHVVEVTEAAVLVKSAAVAITMFEVIVAVIAIHPVLQRQDLGAFTVTFHTA